jgi:hypothetical protein
VTCQDPRANPGSVHWHDGLQAARELSGGCSPAPFGPEGDVDPSLDMVRNMTACERARCLKLSQKVSILSSTSNSVC